MDTGETFDKKKHSIILLHGSGQSHVVWSLTGQYLSDQNYITHVENRDNFLKPINTSKIKN